MPIEVIIAIGVIAVGYGLFVIFSSKSDSAKNKRSSATTTPYISKLHKSKTGMMQRIRENNYQNLHEATLITTSRLAREDFIGTVDVIDGHHNTLPLPSYDTQTVPKGWEFFGAIQSDAQFKQEIDAILEELKRDGWTLKPGQSQGRVRIWLMNR